MEVKEHVQKKKKKKNLSHSGTAAPGSRGVQVEQEDGGQSAGEGGSQSEKKTNNWW